MLRSIIVAAVCGIACRSSAPAKQRLQPGSGTFSVDADQAVHEIEVKLRWGTFAIRRAD